MNFTTLCTDIQFNFVLGYCIAAAPDPARDIGVQIAALKLEFLQCTGIHWGC